MRKDILTFLLLVLSYTAYSQNIEIARNFGENFRLWTVTQSETYRANIEKMCDGKKKTVVADAIATDLAIRNNYPRNKSYELDSYLNWLDKQIDEISISFSDFEVISKGDLGIYTTKDLKTAEELSFVACKIQVRGALSYDVQDLLYIRNGKISKIDTYDVDIDKKTGKKRIRVDFSDLAYDNEETVGLTYNYSKAFPFGGSFYYAWEGVPILLSVDFGYDNKKEEYITDKVEMTNIMNYTRTKQKLDPKYYMTITPHAYFKYFAIGCGFGCLIMEGKEEKSTYNYTSTSEGNGHGGGSSTETDTNLFKFMIRPTVKGFIPLDDDDVWSIVVSASYNCAFGYTEKNGFDVGLGIKVNLDW